MKKYSLLLLFFLWMSLFTNAQRRSFYFLTSDSVKLYVEVAGTGRPVVFVHGGPGSNSFYFSRTAAAPLLEEQLQMIYFDQRGCGRSSSAPDKNYSLERMLLDLEELRQYMGYARWDVMGHSFGGTIVTPYALRYPKSVDHLMLIHCTLDVYASVKSHIQFGIRELQLADSTALMYGDAPLMQRLATVHEALFKANRWYKLMFRNAFEKSLSDSWDDEITDANTELAGRIWGIDAYFADMTKLTKDIHCPVLVMTGSMDYAIGPDHYRRFLFPHRKVVVYRGGHASFQEEPQWFSEQIFSFLKLMQ